MGRQIIFILLLTLLAAAAHAQQPDTVKRVNPAEKNYRKKDSLTSKPFVPRAPATSKVYHPDSTHSPGKAFRRSAMIPGWGQLYNHRWWKVPIIYTGIGLLGAAIVFNNNYYHQYLTIAKYYRNGGVGVTPESPYYDIYKQYQSAGISQQAIEDAASGYQRNFQLSILGTVGAWGIQMIDAYIDAKFIHSYTMDNDLSFKLSPGIMPQSVYASNNMANFTPVLKLTITLSK